MSACLICAGEVVTLDPEDRVYRPGGIHIEDGHLVRIGPLQAFAGSTLPTIDLLDRLVMPGLVNAHTHTPMVLFRGLAEGHSLLTLEGWYNAIRTWELYLQAEMVPPAVAVSCAEMIRTGTTCFADQYFYMDQIVPVVEKSGLRAALAFGIVELGDTKASARALSQTAAFLHSLQGHPRLRGWIGPHALFADNRPETIESELRLAQQFDTGLHIHLATSGEEDRICQEQYGHSAVQQMKLLGILEHRLLAAHCLTIPKEDLSTLAAAPFTAVIVPSSFTRSGATAPPLRAMFDAGLNMALGTDNVANNNSYDLFQDMRLLGKIASFVQQQPAAIPARQIVRMATLGGAWALGLEKETGSLEAGKRADLISLDLNEIGWAPTAAQDIYTALVYSVSGMHVRDVMVNGHWLLRDAQFTTLDYRAACTALDEAYADLSERRAQGESTRARQ
ncbi:MAG: amidohydrolase family protein [Chloroflexi bacterium]|nr:amidohydrolase family protein [Chloroflexota bacterium]